MTSALARKKQKIRRYFPDFKRWLEFEEDEELAIRFRYGMDFNKNLLGNGRGNDDQDLNPQTHKTDIRDFHAKLLGKRVVWFQKSNPQKAAFIDTGKFLVLGNDFTEESVLAALQLANQKFGGKIRIDSANEKFRQLCVKLAAENNFTLTNPDLADQVKALKEKMAFDKLHDNLRGVAEDAKKRGFNKSKPTRGRKRGQPKSKQQQESASPKTQTIPTPTPAPTPSIAEPKTPVPAPSLDPKLPLEPAAETTGVQTFEYGGTTYTQGDRIEFKYHNQPTTAYGELVSIEENGKALIKFSNQWASGTFTISLEKGTLRLADVPTTDKTTDSRTTSAEKKRTPSQDQTQKERGRGEGR